MKSTLLLSPLLLLLYVSQLFAQQDREKHWGNAGYDAAFCAAATRDGGYVISGLSQSKGDSVGDIVVIKINSNCDTMWTMVYGGPKLEGGNDVIQTADGGILVSGHTEDFGAHDCDAFLMKLGKNGEHEWLKVYGGDEDDISEGVVELPGGDFVMAGITASYGNPVPSELRHSWFIRTNHSGDTIWTKCYGGGGEDYGYSIAASPAGGFLAVGYTASRGQGEKDGWLLRMQENGDTLWTRTYHAGGDTRFYRIIPSRDNNFILAGYTQAVPGGPSHGLLVKVNAEGAELWKNTYGTDAEDIAFHGVAELPNGNLMLSGVDHRYNTEGNAYLLTTDEQGRKISEEIFGGPKSCANAIAVQGNNSYLTAGYSSKWGDAAGDLFYTEASNTGLPLPPTDVSISLIFPNPVENRSSVILPASYAYQAVRLDILDISGHLVSSQENIQGKDLVIERKQLPEGQYVFRVSCKDGTVFHERFTIE